MMTKAGDTTVAIVHYEDRDGKVFRTSTLSNVYHGPIDAGAKHAELEAAILRRMGDSYHIIGQERRQTLADYYLRLEFITFTTATKGSEP